MNTTQQHIADLISQTNGAFFNVTFTKRTTGEQRTITGRTGVHKYTNGVGLKYDRSEKALIGVWVSNEGKIGADAYRSIPIEGIVAAVIGGQQYTVEQQ